MEVFKMIIDQAYSCFQWRVPFINCSMWQCEIALAVGAIVVYFIRKLFEE